MAPDLNKILKELGLDRKLLSLYNRFAEQASRYLAMLRDPANDIEKLKIRNPFVYRQLEQLQNEFSKEFERELRISIISVWEAAERNQDSLLMKFLKGSGLVIGGSMLLKIFNRVGDPDQVTLGTILRMERNRTALEAFLKNTMKLSPRVWILTRQNMELIRHYTAAGLSKGQPAVKIARDLKQFLRYPDKRFRRIRNPETGKLILSSPAKDFHPGQGVYRSSFQNALRLSRSETNMAYRLADHSRWKQIDFVLGFEVKLSANHPEPDICDAMAGRYGKNFVFQGWHPQCFCYSVPILPTQEQFIKYLETERIPKSLKVDGIPPRAFNYVRDKSPQLLKAKSKPFFLENFTAREGTFYPKKNI